MSKLFGGILLAVGILVAGTSGLCSLVLLVSMAGQNGGSDGLPIVLILGGIPFLLGSGLVWLGWKMMRSNSGD